MILIKPSVEIKQISYDPLALIEDTGRICYKSEDKITADSKILFTKNLLKRGHESVIEHAVATVKFICDRGVSHEIVRHRIASYSQESTRYCDYNKDHVTFIIPPWLDIIPGAGFRQSDFRISPPSNGGRIWIDTMLRIEEDYRILRGCGWKPEQARSILPNALKTELIMTANLREWRHFFKLRCALAAHPQMREVAIPLLAEFKEAIPVIFEDLYVTI